MEIVWQKEAIDNISSIEEFIAIDSPERARNFRSFLIEKTELILENPYIGRIVPEFNDTNIRELIIKNYRIVYHLSEIRISILTVIEGHKLLK